MKLLRYSLIVFCISIIFFSSCKNDLKLDAPYKEIPSIYAVLDAGEDIQMIRINKVFLGETDANQMAKVADSINYQPDEITVSLMHSSNPTITVFTESVITTDAGTFNSTQRVYVSPANFRLQSSGIYTLTVHNNYTGNVFTATATAISKIDKDKQISNIFSPPYYPYPDGTNPNLYIDYTVLYPTFPYTFRFFTNEADIYKVSFRMHFYDTLYNGNKIFNYVDYSGGNIDKNGKEEITVSFRGADIFTAAGIGLSKLKLSNDIVGRKMYKMEYIINSSTQEYIDYLAFVAPSLSLNQNKPLYTNFKDGKALGIFTFRTTFSMSKSISTIFVNAFSSNANTCAYKFLNSNNIVLGCK